MTEPLRILYIWLVDGNPVQERKLAGIRRRSPVQRAVSVDDVAVARSAFRELSAIRPASFAVVEWNEPVEWSRRRAHVFRSLVAGSGKSCPLFAGRRHTAIRCDGQFNAMATMMWFGFCGKEALNTVLCADSDGGKGFIADPRLNETLLNDPADSFRAYLRGIIH